LWLDGVITFAGRQRNLDLRGAAFVAVAINPLMVVAAILSIVVAIPARKPQEVKTRCRALHSPTDFRCSVPRR
jgi:hypothetical protein